MYQGGMTNAYVRLLGGWLGGVKKGQKYAYVILEWSLCIIQKGGSNSLETTYYLLYLFTI